MYPNTDRAGDVVSFSLHAVPDTDVVVLRLAGELDLAGAPALSDHVDHLLDGGRHRILVDLSELEFCDSTGLGALVRGHNRCAADGGWLRLTAPSPQMTRLLALTGLGEVLMPQEATR